MSQWYAAVSGQQYGPVDEEQFRAWIAEGRIKPDHYVWTEGMPNWLPLSQVGQFSLPPAIPLRKHRGAAVLILGLVGLVCCCVPFGLVSIVTGVISLVMGVNDLRAMDRGQMDAGGRGLTTAGMIFGIISILLGVAAMVAMLIHGIPHFRGPMPYRHWMRPDSF
jgi:hypothetical protein